MSQFESIDEPNFHSGDLNLPDSQIWERLVVPAAEHTSLVDGFRAELARFAKSMGLRLVQKPSGCEAKALNEIKQGFVTYVGDALAHDCYTKTTQEDPDRLSVEFHSEFVLRGPDGRTEIVLLSTVHNSHKSYLIFDHAKQPVVVPSPAMTILLSTPDSDSFCINPIYSPAAVEYLWALLFTDLEGGRMREHNSPFLDCLVAAAAVEFDVAEEQVYASMIAGNFEMTDDWKILFEIGDCSYCGEIRLTREGSIFMVDIDEDE